MTAPAVTAPVALRDGDGTWAGTRPWSPAPLVVAGTLALLAMGLGWRGADLPGQMHRFDLFREHGFLLWDNLWFGGHSTIEYSVLSPVIGAITGPILLGALSSIAAAFCFDRLLRAHFGSAATIGSMWFAISTVTNSVVGRITFFVGVAFALAALLAVQRGRRWAAAGLSLLCALASPVSAVFLAIGLVAWGSVHRSRWLTAGAVLSATAIPMLVVAVVFPSGGVFPFETWALLWNLTACAVVLVALPRDEVVLRRATMLYALANLAVYAVPNPLGGNISRLAQYTAGPILACVLPASRRRRLAIVALPLIFWQWFPAVDGIALARSDPSTHAEFYAPLLKVLDQPAAAPARVEVVMTRRHWESAYAADGRSLARGWETQLDLRLNPVFYDGTLTADTYERWLSDQGVRYVALPAAPLDDSAVAEAALLSSGLPYLTPIWHNADWQLWRFDGSPGLVTGPATLTALGPDSLTLNVTAPGDVLVRVRSSAHWAVPEPGCAAADPSGWTVLRGLPIGPARVTQALRGTPCPRGS